MGKNFEGGLLWEPTEEQKKRTQMYQFMQWLQEKKGIAHSDYNSLWKWSVNHIEDFWEGLWEYFEIKSSKPYSSVLRKREMPGTNWFPGSRLNYSEHVFRNSRNDKPAIVFQSENTDAKNISWAELNQKTAAVATWLRSNGVKPGDRIVAYMPNIPETIIAFLACASIGAVWSSCSPDFGISSVIDRFKQIEPTILFAVDGYTYNGKSYDRQPVIGELQEALTTLKNTVIIPYLDQIQEVSPTWRNTVLWEDVLKKTGMLTFEALPFNHPLWILYSSGTTGLPKPIVHGQGGIILEHIKAIALQSDLSAEDNLFWFTTTGWMMWNFILVGGLLVGSTITLYDGSPSYPSLDVLWELAEKSGVTYFGTSASYINSCIKNGMKPGETFDLKKLRGIGSTGSPLTSDGFKWVYENIKKDLWLVSTSGGTDVCTAFVGGSPLLPVHAGEIQCRQLGVKADAFDEHGQSLLDEVGELVIKEPMPSMPLYFWNDPDGRRYKDSYFDSYQKVWRQGDWISITASGSCVIYGRSDSTINRQGVRMGTSEIYQAVEGIDEILDSLVIDLEYLGRKSQLSLFVVFRPGFEMNNEIISKINKAIQKQVTPRHVPDKIYTVEQIPRTLSGKKMEVPIRRILLGHSIEKSVNPDSMSNPESLDFFINLSKIVNHARQ